MSSLYRLCVFHSCCVFREKHFPLVFEPLLAVAGFRVGGPYVWLVLCVLLARGAGEGVGSTLASCGCIWGWSPKSGDFPGTEEGFKYGVGRSRMSGFLCVPGSNMECAAGGQSEQSKGLVRPSPVASPWPCTGEGKLCALKSCPAHSPLVGVHLRWLWGQTAQTSQFRTTETYPLEGLVWWVQREGLCHLSRAPGSPRPAATPSLSALSGQVPVCACSRDVLLSLRKIGSLLPNYNSGWAWETQLHSKRETVRKRSGHRS